MKKSRNFNLQGNSLLNKISGCIAGLFIGSLLITEVSFISSYIFTDIPEKAKNALLIVESLLAAIVFFLTVRRFWRRKRQSLTSYYLEAVLISTAAVFLLLYIFLRLIGRLVPLEAISGFFSTVFGVFVQYNLFYFLFAFFVFAFAGIFSGMTRKKVLYIQMISRDIKKIRSEGFGRKIPVYGNDELADLCISINEMSEELLRKEENEKQIEKQKKQLITNVSHDLRSPLTSIIGYVTLIKEMKDKDSERLQEYISVVERRLQGLNHLINELFELTKLDSEDIKLKMEETDITPLIHHIAEEYSILYHGYGLKMEKNLTGQAFYMNVDTEKLVRAIQNLLDNAGKYAKRGSVIEIGAAIEEKEGGRQFLFSVANEVEENQEIALEHLFERTYKGDVSRSDTHSSGLGLAIAKRIVQLHQGRISVKRKGNVIVFEMIYPEGEGICKGGL